MAFIYKILYALIFILACPYWLWRIIWQPNYWPVFKVRLLGPKALSSKAKNRPRVWLWALSLGEIISAKELVLALEEKGAEVIISATTLSGLKAAEENWPGRIILPSPFDFTFTAKKFIKILKPDLFVLVETDIWPNILRELSKEKVVKVLVSARLSDKTFKGYSKIKFFWAKVLSSFNLITAQTQEDKNRLLGLGVQDKKIFTFGNLKFDKTPSETGAHFKKQLLQEAGWPLGASWLVAGSFHSGEEILILNCYEKLIKKHKNLKLLLAPREKGDFEKLSKLIKNRGLILAKRSQPKNEDLKAQIFLLDTFGELEKFYELADIALIGKSWPGAHEGGGHNPLEASARAKAVIFGDRMQNFKWMAKALIESKAAEMILGEEDLLKRLGELLQNPQEAEKMGENGKAFILKHQGALEKTVKLLIEYWENKK